jgi:hypothetical protein
MQVGRGWVVPDLAMSVTLSRTLLGLGDLEINDHLNYAVGPQLLGGTVAWNRQKATSPFLDGEVTTQRSRQNVTEQVAVEVYAGDAAELKANTAALITAFCQDSFVLTVTLEGTFYVYQCEAADVTIAWVGARMMAHQGQVTFAVPRQPVPLLGAV